MLQAKDDPLARQKLELEIQKLRKEIDSIGLGPWLQAATIGIALAAAAVSLWSALKSQEAQRRTLEIQINHQQKERISALLEDLGSEHQGVKIAAIQALSEYSESHSFLVNLLKYEREGHVVDSIITALCSDPAHAVPLIVLASDAINDQKLTLATELYCSGLSKDEVLKLIKLENKFFTKWLDSSRGKRVVSSFKAKISYLQASSKSTEQELLDKEKVRILGDWHELNRAYANILRASEEVIDAAIKKNLQLAINDAYLREIILDRLDLSGWSFLNCDLQDSSFREAICSKINFRGSTLDRSSFKAASLHDSVFDSCSCKHTSFETAKLNRASLRSIQAFGAAFYGTRIKNTDFTRAHLVQADFDRAVGEKPNFTAAVLKGTKLTNCLINEATISGVDLSGAVLTSIQARRVKFIDSKLAGNNLEQADFRGSSFVRLKLEAIKNFAGAEFAGASFEGLKYDEESKAFFEYMQTKAKEPYVIDNNSGEASDEND